MDRPKAGGYKIFEIALIDERLSYSPRLIRSQLRADKTGAECRHVEDDHNKGKEIHSHHEPTPEVHPANEDQPNLSRLAVPNKKWISDFQHTNKDSCNWEQVPPSHEYLRIDNVEGRTDESAPYIGTIPPPGAEAFHQAAEKIDDTQVKLKEPTPKTQKLWIPRSRFPQSPVQRILIRQRRQHQVKESDGHEVIHAIRHESAALGCAQVKKPRQYRGEPRSESHKKTAAGNE
jgi:hypothetical protein